MNTCIVIFENKSYGVCYHLILHAGQIFISKLKKKPEKVKI